MHENSATAMLLRRLLYPALPVVAAALLWSCVGIDTSSMILETPQDVLNKVCTKCHDKERICENVGKDKAFFAKTVRRMNTYGANLDQRRTDMIVGFLAEQDSGSTIVCGQ